MISISFILKLLPTTFSTTLFPSKKTSLFFLDFSGAIDGRDVLTLGAWPGKVQIHHPADAAERGATGPGGAPHLEPRIPLRYRSRWVNGPTMIKRRKHVGTELGVV